MRHCLTILLFVSVLMFGCVRDADLDTGVVNVVVDCVLEDADVQSMQLHYTTVRFGDEPEAVNGAGASVTDVTDGSTYQFVFEGNGRYSTEMTPVQGHSYRLDVNVEGRDPISAFTSFPEIPDLKGYQRYNYMINIASASPCVVWFYGMSESGELEPYIASSHHETDEFNHVGMTLSDFSDRYDGHPYKWGDPGYDNLYRWYTHLIVTPDPELDFSVGRYVGETVDSTEASRLYYYLYDSYVHDRFARIPISDTYDNGVHDPYGNYQKLFFLVSCSSRNGAILHAFVCSEDYDRYLKDIYVYVDNMDSSLETFYDHTNIYSNVINGVGIFGAKASITIKPELRWYTTWKYYYGMY